MIIIIIGNDDAVTLQFHNGEDHTSFMFETRKQTRISNFNLKLIDIDSEHLGVPDTEYDTVVKMPSAEFSRIVKELQHIGDTVNVHVSKEGIAFRVMGDTGSGTIVCKQTSKTADSKDDEDDVTFISNKKEISLTFALRYLCSFAKATPLCSWVILKMSEDVPLVVEYQISNSEDKDMGHLRYYLAPKIEEEDDLRPADKGDEKEAPDNKKDGKKMTTTVKKESSDADE